jgi:hypothetical protein
MTDPLDKQLVEVALSGGGRRKADLEEAKLAGVRTRRVRSTRIRSTTTICSTTTKSPRPRPLDDDARLGVEVVEEDVDGSAAPRRRAGQARRRRARGADAGRARRPFGRHDRDRRPGPDVPEGDRQGRPPDGRRRGRPGQGHRARRADGRRALEGHPSPSTSGPTTTPSARPARSSRSYRLPFGPEAPKMVADAVSSPDAADLLVPTIDFHLIKAGKEATTDGTKELIKEARHLVQAYNDSLTPDLPDACSTGPTSPSTTATWTRATTSGCGRSTTGPATKSPTRRCKRWIEGGHDAELLKRLGHDPEVPLNTKLAHRRASWSGSAATRASS